MSDPETRAIAARLTKAQRRALLWLPADGSWRQREKGTFPEVSFYILKDWHSPGDPREVPVLRGKLVDGTDRPPIKNARGTLAGWGESSYRITPLGLRVRAVLAEQEAAHDPR